MRFRFRYRLVIFAGIAVLSILRCVLPQFVPSPTMVSPFLGPVSLSVLALLFAILCFWKRRFLCRTVCPLGCCFDAVGMIRKKATGSNRLPRIFVQLPKCGVFFAVLTWFGCFVGVVGFLWLDPFVLFGSLFRIGSPFFPVAMILLVMAWFAPTFWCSRVCPLGGTQEILYSPKSLRFQHFNRRRTLLFGLQAALFGLLFGIFRHRTKIVAATLPVPIRPPGAVREELFLARCTRCGACSQVCPTQLLQIQRFGQNFDNSIFEYGTPHAVFDPAWCKDDCTACTQVCPSGALQKISSDAKKNVKIGLAVLEFEHCRLYDDRECSICGRECPFDAIAFEWSETEYRKIPVIDPIKCTGCGRCVVTCPVGGDSDQTSQKPLRITAIILPKTY